jgi:hypothetical protein
MLLIVKENKTQSPGDIKLLGIITVVFEPGFISH